MRHRSDSRSRVVSTPLYSVLTKPCASSAPRRPRQQFVVTLTPLNDTFTQKHIQVATYPDVTKLGRPTGAKHKPDVSNGYFDLRVLSRNHAQMFFDPFTGKLMLQDLGSSNGTFVNDAKLLREPAEIRVGDIVVLGFNVQTELTHKQISLCIEDITIEASGLYSYNSPTTNNANNSNTAKPASSSGFPFAAPLPQINTDLPEYKHATFIKSMLSALRPPKSTLNDAFDAFMFGKTKNNVKNDFQSSAATTMPSKLHVPIGLFPNAALTPSMPLANAVQTLSNTLNRAHQHNLALASLEKFWITYLAQVQQMNTAYLENAISTAKQESANDLQQLRDENEKLNEKIALLDQQQQQQQRNQQHDQCHANKCSTEKLAFNHTTTPTNDNIETNPLVGFENDNVSEQYQNSRTSLPISPNKADLDAERDVDFDAQHITRPSIFPKLQPISGSMSDVNVLGELVELGSHGLGKNMNDLPLQNPITDTASISDRLLQRTLNRIEPGNNNDQPPRNLNTSDHPKRNPAKSITLLLDGRDDPSDVSSELTDYGGDTMREPPDEIVKESVGFEIAETSQTPDYELGVAGKDSHAANVHYSTTTKANKEAREHTISSDHKGHTTPNSSLSPNSTEQNELPLLNAPRDFPADETRHLLDIIIENSPSQLLGTLVKINSAATDTSTPSPQSDSRPQPQSQPQTAPLKFLSRNRVSILPKDVLITPPPQSGSERDSPVSALTSIIGASSLSKGIKLCEDYSRGIASNETAKSSVAESFSCDSTLIPNTLDDSPNLELEDWPRKLESPNSGNIPLVNSFHLGTKYPSKGSAVWASVLALNVYSHAALLAIAALAIGYGARYMAT